MRIYGKIVISTIVLLIFLTVTSYKVGLVAVKGSDSANMKNNELILPQYDIQIGCNLYFLDKPYGNIYMIRNGSIQSDLKKKKSSNVKGVENEKLNQVTCKLTNTSVDSAGILAYNGLIYFIDNSSGKLCSMKADGSCLTEIGNCKVLMPYQPMFVLDGKLYFYNMENVLVQLNEQNKLRIINNESEKYLYNISANSLVDQNRVYYWDDSGIYSIGMNETTSTRVSTQYVYDKLCSKDQYLYFIDNMDLKPYRIKKADSSKVRLSGEKAIQTGTDFDSGNIQIGDENILVTENNILYKIDKKTTKKQKIMEKVAYFILMKDTVYYMDKFDAGTLYKWNLSDERVEKISTGDFIPFIDVQQGYIFYGIKCAEDENPNEGAINFKKI